MNVEHELLSPVRCRAHFEIEAAQVSAAFHSVIGQFTQSAQIKGFRPGKAPPATIERLYAKEIRDRVLDKLLKQATYPALDTLDIDRLSPPEVDKLSELRKGDPLQVWVQFDIKAKLALTGYQGAQLAAIEVTVTDTDVEAELDMRRQNRAELAPVDGQVQADDELDASYSLTRAGAEQPFDTNQLKAVKYAESSLPAVVYAAFAGAKAGEDIDKTLADPQNPDEFVRVVATIEAISRRVLPDLDDEFAVDLGHETIAVAQAAIRAELQLKADAINRGVRVSIALDHLLAHNDVPVARGPVLRHVDQQMQSMRERLGSMVASLGKFFDSYRTMMIELATDQFKRSLAIEAIADAEGVQSSPDDAMRVLQERVTANPKQAKQLRSTAMTPQGHAELAELGRMDRARQLLVDVAQWTVSETLSLADHHARKQAPDQLASVAASGDLVSSAAPHVHGPDCDHDHHDDGDHRQNQSEISNGSAATAG
ncbi:MAG: trigger factor [Myxococcales bacterium]|nr:trigger factor [Myxococcales bacterium]